MEKVFHSAESRGQADHGWLRSRHTFSFAGYFDRNRMNFGALRVLNDDIIEAARGFDTHPHKDMEIVSVPVTGALRHKDSQGNETVIPAGEIQLMSAGTGVTHSEYNHSQMESANFLQIWILPKKLGIAPRYDQMKIDIEAQIDRFQALVSPLGGTDPGIKINQDAWLSMADLSEGAETTYEMKKSTNGVYFFLIAGRCEIVNEMLDARDALGLVDCDQPSIKGLQRSKILAIEVPLEIP